MSLNEEFYQHSNAEMSPDPLHAPHHGPRRVLQPLAAVRHPVQRPAAVEARQEQVRQARPLDIPRVANDGAYLKDGGQPPSVTWVGHSPFAVQDGGERLPDRSALRGAGAAPRAAEPAGHPPRPPCRRRPSPCSPTTTTTTWTTGPSATCRRRSSWFVPLGLAGVVPRPGAAGSWSSTGGRASAMAGGPSPACRPSTGRTGSAWRATPRLWCSWLLDCGDAALLLRRRLRLLPRLRRDRPPFLRHRRRLPPHRRLRAALVHAPPARRPRGGLPGLPRPRRPRR